MAGRPRISEGVKLSTALAELHGVLGSERGVVRGSELKNATRLLLLDRKFLRQVIRGWYFVSDPAAGGGDTTPFYANFWEYLARYLDERFGIKYCLSAEHSMLRHAASNVVPQQVAVHLGVAQSQVQPLAFAITLNMYPATLPPPAQVYLDGRLRLMSAAYSLVMLSPTAYQTWARDVQIVLATLGDPGAVSSLAEVNASGVGRVVAACRLIGRQDFADRISQQVTTSGIHLPDVADPFRGESAMHLGTRPHSPLYSRVSMLWERHRQVVVALRPEPADFGLSTDAFRQKIEATKEADAYHSLSIERYRVTPDLIQKVASGKWSPGTNESDQQQTEAMAARGYLDTFNLVRDDAVAAFETERTLPGTAAKLFSTRHGEWFVKMFTPSVEAGLLKRQDLVGYRRHMVFLRGSRHVPPHFDYVNDGMAALGECLAGEPDGFVRAVLGHWLLGFIHPYMDGNGRMARFAMNLMLASGGYPWTVIRVENRETYMKALESASVEDKAEPFAAFIADCVCGAY